MGWESKADLALRAATSSGAFGEVVDYRPVRDGAEPYQIRGVFDDDHQELLLEGDTPVSGTGPMVSVRLADMQEPPRESDQLLIRGKLYVVVDAQPDGQGSSDLILNLLDEEPEA